MEKALKDKNLALEEKVRVFILTGDTSPYEAEFTNLEGKKLKGSQWSFPIKDKDLVLKTLLEPPKKPDGEEYTKEERILLDPGSFSTEELLAYCRREEIPVGEEDRETCITAIYAAKKVPEEDVRQKIREELEKEADSDPTIENVDPKPIYTMVCTYFGSHLCPPYEAFLKLLQEEVDVLGIPIAEPSEKILSAIEPEAVEEVEEEEEEREKPPLLKGLQLPVQEMILPLPPPKKRTQRKRKKKTLEVDAKSERLFDTIRKGLSRDIVSVTPVGLEFIYAETLDDIVQASVEEFLALPVLDLPPSPLPEGTPGSHPGEEDKMYALRVHITTQIQESPDLELTPDTIVLLGYLISKKIQYGVRYGSYVEAAIHYVTQRIE